MTYSVKKIAAFLLALAMMVNLLPAGVLAEDYNKNSDPIEINFTKGGGAKNRGASEVMIPEIAKAETFTESLTDASGEPLTFPLSRNASLRLSVDFTVDDEKKELATDGNPAWVYDLSSLCGDEQIFEKLTNSTPQPIYNGTIQVGTYEIVDNKVKLQPDPNHFNPNSSNMWAAFSVNLKLNDNYEPTESEHHIKFPGGTDTTITTVTKDLTADKKVNRTGAYYDAEGTETTPAGIMVTKDENGHFHINYRISLSTTTVPNTLTIQDVLSARNASATTHQTLDADSLRLVLGSGTGATELSGTDLVFTSAGNPNADGFELDVMNTLRAKGIQYTAFDANTAYYLYYSTTVTDSDINQNPTNINRVVYNDQKNTATIKYDSLAPVEKTTVVSPSYFRSLNAVKKAGTTPDTTYVRENPRELYLTPKEDGSVDVWYSISVTPTEPTDSLTVTDTYPAGYSIDWNTAKFYIIDTNFIEYVSGDALTPYIDTNNNNPGFTFNASDCVKGNTVYSSYVENNKLVSGATYLLEYCLNVPADKIGQMIENTANWTCDYGSTNNVVQLTPRTGNPQLSLTKSVYYAEKGDQHNVPIGENEVVKPGDLLSYVIRVSDVDSANGARGNLAGAVITDYTDNFVGELVYLDVLGDGDYPDPNARPNKYVYIKGQDEEFPGWNLEIEPAHAITNSGSGNEAGSVGDRHKLFTLTFPSDRGAFLNTYAIYYTVRVLDDPADDPIIGRRIGNNTGKGVGDSQEAESTATVTIDYNTPDLHKRLMSVDRENNEVTWAVAVELPDGIDAITTPLTVEDIPYYSGIARDQLTDKTTVTGYSVQELTDTVNYTSGTALISGEERSSEAECINPNDYYVTTEDTTYGNKVIFVFPKGIDTDILITVRTKPERDFAGLKDYYFKNSAVEKGDGFEMTKTQIGETHNNNIEFDKTGVFDKEHKTATWTVEINPENLLIDPDFVPVFTDTLPEGMALADNKVRIAVDNAGNKNGRGVAFENWTGDITLAQGDVSTNDDGQVVIQFNLKEKMKAAYMSAGIIDSNSSSYPLGIYGTHYTITYTTKLTAEKQAEIDAASTDYPQNYRFTNEAVLKKSGGEPVKTASATVKYQYEQLVDKVDASRVGLESGQEPSELKYVIHVNQRGKNINSENDVLTLSDAISDDMSLVLGSISVVDGNTGADVDCNVSYDETIRRLVIEVPDKQYIKISFTCLPLYVGQTHEYVNTVSLTAGEYTQSDTTQNSYTATSTASAGSDSYDIGIEKINLYNLTEHVSDCVFELYQYEVDDDGSIKTQTLKGTETTDNTGIIRFPIEPEKLYSWKETQAKEGYEIADTADQYFIVYNQLRKTNYAIIPFNTLQPGTQEALQDKYNVLAGLTPTSADEITIITPDSTASVGYTLTSTEYPDDQGYNSLTTEVNQILRDRAEAMGELIKGKEKIKITYAKFGTSFTAANIKNDVKTLELEATKKMTGRALKAEEFTFELWNVTNPDDPVLVDSSTKNPDGAADGIASEPFKFKKLTYKSEGTYKYEIKETEGTDGTVLYDTTVYEVTVSVTSEVTSEGKVLNVGTPVYKKKGSTATASHADFENKLKVKDLTGKKVWVDNATTHDNSKLKLTLHQSDGTVENTYTTTLPKGAGFSWGTGDNADTYTYSNLPIYDESGNAYTYWVTEETVEGYAAPAYSSTDGALDGGTITNKKLTSVSGTKTWDDADNLDGKRPDSVAVQLYADGKEVDGKTATIDSTTLAYEWTDLPMYNEDGTPIVYTVKEVSETNGKLAGKNGAEYTVDYAEPVVNADGSTTADITNSYAPGKTDFTATKTWVDDDNTYSTRPASLTLTLMKRLEGEKEVTAVENPPDPTVTKNDDNTWTYKWEDLPERENSKTIIYSVVENTEPAGYAKSNETANAVTNTWKTGEKTVNDYVSIYKEDKARNQLKGAEFTLYKADTCEESDRIKIYSGETFTIDTADKDLEQYLPADKSKPITLYLKETKAPDGYILDETVYSVIITVDISDPTYDADKDAFITTTTYAVKINEKTSINIPNEKTYVKLSKVDATTEEELDGATIQIIDSEGNVVVEWVSEAGKPLEVTGLKTGEEYTLHETAAPNGYLVTSDTKFVIDEHGKVTGSATVSVDENGNQTLLVKDEMKKLSAAVKKVWEDDNDRDALREDSIEVKLLQNGETYDTATLSAKNNWTYIATGLPAVDEKLEDYIYEWEETGTVEGYTATKKTEGILTVLTNTHGPEETAVTVKKAWNDNDNAAGKRPESVTVQLYADGQAAGKPVELNAANGWSATWDHLVKNTNEDGQAKPIVYTVAETEIPKGYTSKITGSMAAGYVITNTLETGKLVIEKQFDIQVPVEGPEEEELTTDIEVVKLWVDNDNRDGNRPASVTVHLYAGGTEVRSAELTAAGGWRKTFGGLPKFVDGRPIKYFVTEDPVEWYVPEIRGFTITNRYTPEVTSVTVKKVWNDEDNKRGRRPLSVAMKLNNGTIVLLSEENNWTETVTELPARVNGKPAEYSWTEQSSLGYVQENVETKDGVTVFTNKLWTGPEGTPAGKKPRTYGETLYNIGEYKTPLGVNEIINHVGDCFD